LTTWLGPDGAKDRERTVVCEEEALLAEIVVDERKKAMEEAETARDGVTLWTDGSRTEDGACGYAVVRRRKGGGWKGHQVHLGYNQEAYDAECAAIVRALRVGDSMVSCHEGIAGNEKSDECVKVAAGQPETHGAEWLTIDNRPRRMPAVSLARLSRQVAEKKWRKRKAGLIHV